jgi:UDP-3-O-[3-hydroxymyristoyl] N-acetylglucosamine deacetylase
VVGNGEGLSASTVEHLMAAFRGCGVDNAVVELDGPEVPIVDGSSAPLVQLIESVGLRLQPVARQYLRVLKAVEVRDGDKFARLSPDDLPRFSVAIDFSSPVIGRQSYSMVLREGAFQQQLAECRTFGFKDELQALRLQGLALGGSLDNAILVEGAQVVNHGGLRRPDEFVRHKMLDSIGDLYLAGAPIVGSYSAFKPGHAMNASLLGALFADADAWCMATSDEIWPEALYPLDPVMPVPEARLLAR